MLAAPADGHDGVVITQSDLLDENGDPENCGLEGLPQMLVDDAVPPGGLLGFTVGIDGRRLDHLFVLSRRDDLGFRRWCREPELRRHRRAECPECHFVGARVVDGAARCPGELQPQREQRRRGFLLPNAPSLELEVVHRAQNHPARRLREGDLEHLLQFSLDGGTGRAQCLHRRAQPASKLHVEVGSERGDHHRQQGQLRHAQHQALAAEVQRVRVPVAEPGSRRRCPKIRLHAEACEELLRAAKGEHQRSTRSEVRSTGRRVAIDSGCSAS